MKLTKENIKSLAFILREADVNPSWVCLAIPVRHMTTFRNYLPKIKASIQAGHDHEGVTQADELYFIATVEDIARSLVPGRYSHGSVRGTWAVRDSQNHRFWMEERERRVRFVLLSLKKAKWVDVDWAEDRMRLTEWMGEVLREAFLRCT